MLIRWLVNCEIEIAQSARSETTREQRHAGDEDDVEIIGYGITLGVGEDMRWPQLQFGDGTVTLCVQRNWFEIISLVPCAK